MYNYTVTIKGKLDTLDQIAQAAYAAQNIVLNAYDPDAKIDLTIKDKAPIEVPGQPPPQE